MGVKIRPDTADAILLSQYLQILPAHTNSLDGLTKALVEDHLSDLLAVTIASALKRLTPQLSETKLFVLLKLRRAIDDRLADPALTVPDIAEAAGVSVRYANAVLARQGSSIRKLIQTTRLARCHRALGDEQQLHLSITDIGFNWGFSDMTHFGRKFKAAYDMLPSEYRDFQLGRKPLRR